MNACCFSAAYTYLRKHYNDINRMRKVVLEEMEKWQQERPTPQNAQIIRQLKNTIAEFDRNHDKEEE